MIKDKIKVGQTIIDDCENICTVADVFPNSALVSYKATNIICEIISFDVMEKEGWFIPNTEFDNDEEAEKYPIITGTPIEDIKKEAVKEFAEKFKRKECMLMGHTGTYINTKELEEVLKEYGIE